MRQRRRLLNVLCGVIGVVGLSLLAYTVSSSPWLRKGIWIVVGYQSFWFALRTLIAFSLRQREPELSRGQFVWIWLTMPIPLLFGVWWGNGSLSAWLAAEEGTLHESP